jgi:hypothetical protein
MMESKSLWITVVVVLLIAGLVSTKSDDSTGNLVRKTPLLNAYSQDPTPPTSPPGCCNCDIGWGTCDGYGTKPLTCVGGSAPVQCINSKTTCETNNYPEWTDAIKAACKGKNKGDKCQRIWCKSYIANAECTPNGCEVPKPAGTQKTSG